jgi:crotonobetainyl-CoA:carnitine CoA-transferase CaiB-like acyl-CoA transferase
LEAFLPLEGYKVLDLTRLLPGPFLTLLLSDLGAEVIKVESPEGGDFTRHTPPLLGSLGGVYLALNRGKKSITLNLKDPKGKEIFLKLVENAHIVVESFRPGTMEKLGLGWETLQKINPTLIFLSIIGYRSTGPYGRKAGHDLNYLALSGFLGISGQDPRRPHFPGGQVADLAGGSLFAGIALLSALLYKEKVKKGIRIEIPMAEGVFSLLMPHLVSYALNPQELHLAPGKMQLNGGIVNYQMYKTKDGRYVTFAALEPKFWKNFLRAIGREDLEPYAFSPAEEGNPAYKELKEIFQERTAQEWEELNEKYDFCCEPVRTFPEVLSDPQFSPLIYTLKAPYGDLPQVALPFQVPGYRPNPNPPPTFSQHTCEILTQLGYTEEEIQTFHQNGVIALPEGGILS